MVLDHIVMVANIRGEKAVDTLIDIVLHYYFFCTCWHLASWHWAVDIYDLIYILICMSIIDDRCYELMIYDFCLCHMNINYDE